jgi:hypothetical protein
VRVIKYVQNVAGRLSFGSNESHATCLVAVAASHSVSSVVLPKPAGAEMSVSFEFAPRRSRSLSLGRATISGRNRGM